MDFTNTQFNFGSAVGPRVYLFVALIGLANADSIGNGTVIEIEDGVFCPELSRLADSFCIQLFALLTIAYLFAWYVSKRSGLVWRLFVMFVSSAVCLAYVRVSIWFVFRRCEYDAEAPYYLFYVLFSFVSVVVFSVLVPFIVGYSAFDGGVARDCEKCPRLVAQCDFGGDRPEPSSAAVASVVSMMSPKIEDAGLAICPSCGVGSGDISNHGVCVNCVWSSEGFTVGADSRSDVGSDDVFQGVWTQLVRSFESSEQAVVEAAEGCFKIDLDSQETEENVKAFEDIGDELGRLVRAHYPELVDNPEIVALSRSLVHSGLLKPQILGFVKEYFADSFTNEAIKKFADACVDSIFQRGSGNLFGLLDFGEDTLVGNLKKCLTSRGALKLLMTSSFIILSIRKDSVGAAMTWVQLMMVTAEEERQMLATCVGGVVALVYNVANNNTKSKLVPQSVDMLGLTALANLVYSLLGHKGNVDSMVISWAERWRAVHGGAKQLELLASLVMEAVNSIYVSQGYPAYFQTPITVWEQEVAGFTRTEEEVEAMTMAQLNEAIKKGDQLLGRGAKNGLRSLTLHTTLSYMIARKHARQVSSGDAALRQEPVVILIHGPPGVGKSLFSGALAAAMGTKTYVWNPTDDFWQGYHENSIMMFDDPLAVDSVERSNLFISIFHKLAGSAAAPLEMADIESKGLVTFRSKVILITTNLAMKHGMITPDSRLKANINDLEALNRRVHLVFAMNKEGELVLEKFEKLKGHDDRIRQLNERIVEQVGQRVSTVEAIRMTQVCVEAKGVIFEEIKRAAKDFEAVKTSLDDYLRPQMDFGGGAVAHVVTEADFSVDINPGSGAGVEASENDDDDSLDREEKPGVGAQRPSWDEMVKDVESEDVTGKEVCHVCNRMGCASSGGWHDVYRGEKSEARCTEILRYLHGAASIPSWLTWDDHGYRDQISYLRYEKSALIEFKYKGVRHLRFCDIYYAPIGARGPRQWEATLVDRYGFRAVSFGDDNSRVAIYYDAGRMPTAFIKKKPYLRYYVSTFHFIDGPVSGWFKMARMRLQTAMARWSGRVDYVHAAAAMLTLGVVVGAVSLIVARRSVGASEDSEGDEDKLQSQGPYSQNTIKTRSFMGPKNAHAKANVKGMVGTVPKMQAQSGFDRAATLWNNVIKISRDTVSRNVNVFGTVIRSNDFGFMVLVPSHFFGGMVKNNDVDITGLKLRFERVNCGKTTVVDGEDCGFWFDMSKDTVIIFVPSKSLGQFKDLTGSMLTASDYKMVTPGFTAWRMLPNGATHAVSGGHVLRQVEYDDDFNGLSYEVEDVMRFEAPGAVGQCGLPYWLDDGRLIGIHIAGSSQVVVSSIIPVEFVKGAFVVAQGALSEKYQGFDMPHCPKNTKLKPSKLWQVVAGKSFDYVDQFGVEKKFVFETPLLPALRKGRAKETKAAVLERLQKCTKLMYDPLLDEVFYDLLDDYYSDYVKDSCDVLSFEDCFRTVGSLNNFDLSTSPGLPWVYLGEPGKTGFVNLEGYRQGLRDSVVSLETKLKALGSFQDLEAERVRLRDIAFECPFQGTYKDETLKPDKITRPIITVGFDFNILLKMYFGRFFDLVKSRYGPVAIGTNPYNDDWRRLYKDLFEVEGKLGADDVKAHQSTILVEDLVVLADYLYRFDPDPERHAVRKRLLVLLGYCCILIDGEIVERWGQNPSGNYLTSLIDSFKTLRMECYTLIKLLREGNPALTASEVTAARRRNMFITVYGDDMVKRVSGKLAELDWTKKAAYFSELGVTVTNSSKDGPPGFEDPKNIRYLSRAFVHDGTLMSAPLEPHILADMLAWDKGRQPDDVHALVRSALREAAEHPIQFYEKYQKILIDALYRTEKIVADPMSYLDRRKTDVLFYDSAEFHNWQLFPQSANYDKFLRNWHFLHGTEFNFEWKRWSEPLKAQSNVVEKEIPADPSVASNEDPSVDELAVEKTPMTQTISTSNHPVFTFYSRTFAGSQGVVGQPTSSLDSLLQRRFQVAQVSWSGTDSPLDILASGNILEQLLSQQSFASRVVGYSAISWDEAVLTVMGVASQGHYGSLGFVAVPDYSAVAPRIDRMTGFKALYANGMVNIAPATNSATSITVPWCSSVAMTPIDIASHWSQPSVGVNWRLVVVTPLRSGASDSTPSVSIGVYVELRGVRLHRPKMIPASSSLKLLRGPIYPQMEAVAKMTMGLAEDKVRDKMSRMTMLNGPIGKIVGGAAKGIVNSFMDKPTSTAAPIRVLPGGSMDRVTMDGISTALPLTDKWGQKVERTFADLGSKVDDMLFTNYIARPESLGVVNVSSSDAVGKRLWYANIDVALPLAPDYLGPLQVLGSMFRWWRGTVRYGFYSPSTTFKSVRLRIAYFPYDFATAVPPATVSLADLADAPSMILEIKGDTIAHVDIPFDHFEPFLRTQLSNDTISGNRLGAIAMYVEAPLVSTDTTADSVVPVSIFRCGLNDFEFAVPFFDSAAGSFYYNEADYLASVSARQSQTRRTNLSAQSHCAMDLASRPPNPIYPFTPSRDWSSPLFGRTVSSFKELLKRTYYYTSFDFSSGNLNVTIPFTSTPVAPNVEIMDINYEFWRILSLFSRFSGSLRFRFQDWVGGAQPLYVCLNVYDGEEFSGNGCYVFDPEVHSSQVEVPQDVPSPWWSPFAIEPFLSRAIAEAAPTMVVRRYTGSVEVGISVGDDFVAAGIVTTCLFYDPTPAAKRAGRRSAHPS